MPTSIAYNMSIPTLHNWRQGNSFTYWAFHSFFKVTFETDNVGLLSILLITCLYWKKNQNWINIKLMKVGKSLKLLFMPSILPKDTGDGFLKLINRTRFLIKILFTHRRTWQNFWFNTFASWWVNKMIFYYCSKIPNKYAACLIYFMDFNPPTRWFCTTVK